MAGHRQGLGPPVFLLCRLPQDRFTSGKLAKKSDQMHKKMGSPFGLPNTLKTPIYLVSLRHSKGAGKESSHIKGGL